MLLFWQVYEFRRIFCLRGGADADKITFTHRQIRGYGGMVDAEDLKSFGYCNRVGSSPTIPTKYCFGFMTALCVQFWMCSSVG